jgi:hypothetical protein
MGASVQDTVSEGAGLSQVWTQPGSSVSFETRADHLMFSNESEFSCDSMLDFPKSPGMTGFVSKLP